MWRESSWGTVCDEGFDENDAQVACHDLGFRSVGWLSNHYKVKMNSYFKSSYKNYIKHIILRFYLKFEYEKNVSSIKYSSPKNFVNL